MTIDRQIAESFQPEVKELERLLDMATAALCNSCEVIELWLADATDTYNVQIAGEDGRHMLRAIEKARNE